MQRYSGFLSLRPLWLFVLAALSLTVDAETLRWKVKGDDGITSEGIARAVTVAKKHFGKSPNDTIILEFDEGTYHLEGKDSKPSIIDLSLVEVGPEGRLVFQGAGIDRTALVFNDNIHAIVGRGVFRVTMAANSPDAVIRDNTPVRCPVQRSKDHKPPKDPSVLID